MDVQTKRIELLVLDLQARAGALAEVFAGLREAQVDIIGCWAYQMGPDQAHAYLYARDGAKAKAALAKLGRQVRTEQACYATGTDQLGVYHDLLRKVANAGVNLEATDAFAVEGKFATVFWVDQKDIVRLCQALGC